MAFSTTEITSSHIASDNPVHQRLFFAYHEAGKRVSGNLLEIGCGVGRGLDVLAASSEQYTGIDKNEELLKHLRQTHPELNFVHSHIPPLAGLKDNQFDYVVTFQVIEHIPDDDFFVESDYHHSQYQTFPDAESLARTRIYARAAGKSAPALFYETRVTGRSGQ
jgi:2-polyprenyl-3-methyl-5-hydroxy-6-metoxy-1,4-benzoquinol methylase